MDKYKLRCSCISCHKETTTSGLYWHTKKGCANISTSILPKQPRKAWNRGLSKETDNRVAAYAANVAIELRDRVNKGWKPPPMCLEARQRLSIEQSLHNRGGKSKWYEVSGIKVQGTWERDIATKLNELNIQWNKPSTNNDVWKYQMDGQWKSYAPDFYLPMLDIWLEIKGYWWGNDRKKMNIILATYPERKLIILEKEDYEKFMRGELVW